MNGQQDDNAPSPDRFVQRDVSDLRETVGRYDERISTIKENMVTKDELTRQWLRMLMFALMLLIPVLAAALGALAIMFSGVVQTALTVS